jgi:hypothetical protein
VLKRYSDYIHLLLLGLWYHNHRKPGGMGRVSPCSLLSVIYHQERCECKKADSGSAKGTWYGLGGVGDWGFGVIGRVRVRDMDWSRSRLRSRVRVWGLGFGVWGWEG